MDGDEQVQPGLVPQLAVGEGKLGAAAAASPDTEPRLDKVESLKSAIAAGTYHVNAELIADSLLRSVTRDADLFSEQPLSILPD